MTLLRLPYALLNASPHVQANDAYSLQVYIEDQAETGRLRKAFVGNGGEAIMCGWCKDRWGFRWQITPRVLMEALSYPEPDTALVLIRLYPAIICHSSIGRGPEIRHYRAVTSASAIMRDIGIDREGPRS